MNYFCITLGVGTPLFGDITLADMGQYGLQVCGIGMPISVNPDQSQ